MSSVTIPLHFREPLARRKACKTISNIYCREDELVFFAFSFSFYPFPGFPRVNARTRSFSVRFTSLFRSSLSSLSLSHSRLFHFLVLASLALINQLINYVLTFLAKKSHWIGRQASSRNEKRSHKSISLFLLWDR